VIRTHLVAIIAVFVDGFLGDFLSQAQAKEGQKEKDFHIELFVVK